MNILDALKHRLIYLDGGIGTLLQEKGLAPGEYPERWNITHSDIVSEIHRSYFEAGSNVVLTNTFGANLLKFSADELDKIICAAVKNARKAQQSSKCSWETWVALDIGPLGKLLRPFGDFDFEEAVSVFAQTVNLGVKYGVDLIMIETMSDCYETKAALLAAKENSSLPVFVSNAYSENGRLFTGATPEAMVAMLEGMRADAIGVNCSFGPAAMRPVVEKYLKYASVPVLVKPNAGMPQVIDGKTVYNVGAEEFAHEMADFVLSGIRIAGGCCGTTPEYIKNIKKYTNGIAPVSLCPKNISVVSSYAGAVSFGNGTVLIGERINPTGKKRFRQALVENDISYVLNEGISQKNKGVQILDVNVGLPEIDESAMLQTVVRELQAVTDLPLQIDTSDFSAMEHALRIYNGKPMINSVNGKQESMDAVFSLMQKYGGVTVALTLDENGIPQTASGRVLIAEKILKTAAKYGISKKDIIFDPLAMTISASADAASVTLQACREIHDKLGCLTSLGVSNVSFGLPGRDTINGAFLMLAMENGLSAAIINPYSFEVMKAYRAYCALHGTDENCAEYIRFIESEAPVVNTPAAPTVPHKSFETASPLQSAIINGLKQDAENLAQKLLLSVAPMDIVKNEVIPALNIVGDGFEKKTLYLPQLLMSAEAAEAAFEQIKVAVSKNDVLTKAVFVLATVKGDIHDIGKNIVRLLLENYGYKVIDLGRDVPPESIVDAVCENHAPFVGLSALMTTTVPAMEATICLLRKKAPWCKIVVGGAVLTCEYAEQIGADHYCCDAMETVRYADENN